MLRQLALVNPRKAGVRIPGRERHRLQQRRLPRAREPHGSIRSDAGHPPLISGIESTTTTARGKSQIRYALDDRVTFDGQLFKALSVFQSQNGQTPPDNPLSLWQPLPMTFCGQFAQFCQGELEPQRRPLPGRWPRRQRVRMQSRGGALPRVLHPAAACDPAGGPSNNPVEFSVADGSNFESGPSSELAPTASRPGHACSKAKKQQLRHGSAAHGSMAVRSRSTVTGPIHCRPCATTGTAFRPRPVRIRLQRSRHGERDRTARTTHP